jgi:hypothetical protein
MRTARLAEAERERNPHMAPDRAAIGQFGAGAEADQGRFAGAVRAEDPEVIATASPRQGYGGEAEADAGCGSLSYHQLSARNFPQCHVTN